MTTTARRRPRSGDHRPAGSREPLMAADLSKLRSVRPNDLGIRFAFGAAVSIVAGLVSMAFGDKFGGMFLAFPAILPATLTLIEKKESTTAAVHAVSAAAIGGAGLIAFGLVVAVLAGRTSIGVVLGTALVAWTFVSVAGYLAWHGIRRLSMNRRVRKPSPPPGHAADVRTTGPGL